MKSATKNGIVAYDISLYRTELHNSQIYQFLFFKDLQQS